MMKLAARLIFLMTLVMSFPACLAAQLPWTVERQVRGQTIFSPSLPAVQLTFADSFRYAGGQRFPLYEIADAEQHFFVDADRHGQVRHLYWIQFEHYLPDNDHRYNYTASHTIEIGGLSFISDTKIYTDYAGLKPQPESDVDKARSLLAGRGFRLPRTAIRARLIHLPGNDNRSELMIIYLEALSPDKLPKDAGNEMVADDRFPQLSEVVIQHAKASLSILHK
jgi:hypothetical protein